MIQGYIPKQMEKKFRKLAQNYISVIEDVNDNKYNENDQILPTLLTNKSYSRTFEVITETQGIPEIMAKLIPLRL